MNLTSWNKRWMGLAKYVSTFSHDPSSKIGAVFISDEQQVLSLGWNGFPRGIADTPERLNDRPAKYSLTSHAEMNAIYNATHNGIPLKNSTLYVYGLPVCSHCALGVIQVGTKEIFQCFDSTDERWLTSAQMSFNIFSEVGIPVFSGGEETWNL